MTNRPDINLGACFRCGRSDLCEHRDPELVIHFYRQQEKARRQELQDLAERAEMLERIAYAEMVLEALKEHKRRRRGKVKSNDKQIAARKMVASATGRTGMLKLVGS